MSPDVILFQRGTMCDTIKNNELKNGQLRKLTGRRVRLIQQNASLQRNDDFDILDFWAHSANDLTFLVINVRSDFLFPWSKDNVFRYSDIVIVGDTESNNVYQILTIALQEETEPLT